MPHLKYLPSSFCPDASLHPPLPAYPSNAVSPSYDLYPFSCPCVYDDGDEDDVLPLPLSHHEHDPYPTNTQTHLPPRKITQAAIKRNCENQSSQHRKTTETRKVHKLGLPRRKGDKFTGLTRTPTSVGAP